VRFLPQVRRKPGRRFALVEAMRDVLKRPAVRNVVARHALFIFAVTYFFTIFSLYVQRVLHGGPQLASWLVAGCGAIGGITLIAAVGPFAKRYGDEKVAQAGIALSIVAYAALGFVHQLWSFCAVLVIWSAGAACVEPTLSALLSKRAPAEERGAALGFNDAMSNLALMAAPALGGFVIDRAIELIGVVPGAALLAAFVLGRVAEHNSARSG
jgi:MFS transporter, DHA1 family, tetracycline resistance protein